MNWGIGTCVYCNDKVLKPYLEPDFSVSTENGRNSRKAQSKPEKPLEEYTQTPLIRDSPNPGTPLYRAG